MILRRVLAHYRLGKSLRPRLENIDFSSQILESFAKCFEIGFLKLAGGRIFDEKTSEAVQGAAAAGFFSKAGLRRLLCGDKPRWLSHKQKASSLLYRKKTTPKLKRSKNEKTL